MENVVSSNTPNKKTTNSDFNYPFTDFIISLADSANFKNYLNNDEQYMTDVGLSEEQKLSVKAKEFYRVRGFLAREMANDSIHARLLNEFIESFNKYSKNDEFTHLTADVDVDLAPNHDVDHDVDHGAEAESHVLQKNYYNYLFKNWQRLHTNEVIFIGTGIKGANHISAEADAYIANASKVLYCVADLAVERKILLLNQNSEDLYIYYGDNKPRRETYEQMVDRILEVIKTEKLVCVVFYGHPGIFVWPSYQAIEKARGMGYKASMLPAISSLDCLFADIGFDPSRYSCQIVEATDLLIRSRNLDVSASVIIFQIGLVGDLGYSSKGFDGRNVPILADYLSSFYGDDYEVIIYEAAQYPIFEPKIQLIKINELSKAKLTGISTMYIPPKVSRATNQEMISKLGIKQSANSTQKTH
ncbi:SAM-dependent methyltransferase [Segetibacter koreensis]|uniref:SAM-dependent methyltransferase n=1 Tax=Segetibacter koreensis TaxID=398037 RepID=UPI000375BFCE|nr:SAM-dependent methyltransferase [Segetibacter koreensis]